MSDLEIEPHTALGRLEAQGKGGQRGGRGGVAMLLVGRRQRGRLHLYLHVLVKR